MAERTTPSPPPLDLQEAVSRASGEIGKINISDRPQTVWDNLRFQVRNHEAAQRLRKDGRRGPKPKWTRMLEAIDFLDASDLPLSDGSDSRCVRALHKFLYGRDLERGERANNAEYLAAQLVALKGQLINRQERPNSN